MSDPRPFQLYTSPLPAGIHVIEASAGTGKTYTLAQLVARLLLEAELHIDQILVVTFTNAAAAELRERIHARLTHLHRLLETNTTPDDPQLAAWLDSLDRAAAQQRLTRALRDMDLAAIHTIDAFSRQVAARHAMSLGLPEDSTLLEDADALDRQLIYRLWQQAMQQVSHEAVELVDWLADSDEVFDLCDKAGPYARFEEDIDDFETCLHRYLTQAGDNPMRTAEERQRLGQRLADLLRNADMPLNKNKINKTWNDIVLPLMRGDFPNWEGLPPSAPTVTDYLHGLALKKHREHWQIKLSPLSVELMALDNLWCHLKALRPAWLKHLHQRWRNERERLLAAQGLFTFDSLRHRLAQAVDGPLAASLRARYRACLIDEFQDTDPDQWRIFSILFRSETDAPRHLFLIGDPKQAIYAFRGANVETYHLAVKAADHRHTLTTNYRSHSALIEGFNHLFAEGEPATFGDPRCRYHTIDAGVDDARVRLTLNGRDCNRIRLLQPKEGGADVLLTRLCNDIVTFLEQGRLGTEQRPVRPQDIAVLVTGHKTAAQVQAALRRAGVPSVRSVPDSLWQTPTSEALLQLMQVLLSPHDGQALNTFLVGPLMRWPLKRLTDGKALAQVQSQLEQAAHQWAREGLMAAFGPLLDNLGCWQTLAAHEDGERRIADLRHLLERLQQQALKVQLPPLELFRWAQRARRDGLEKNALRLESDKNAVEIATIHASKGLQYPITLVYGDWKTKQARRPHVVVEAGGRRVGFSEALRQRQSEAEQQERLRLFYVACTRAESHLGLYVTEPGVIRHLIDKDSGRRKALDARPDLFEAIEVSQETPLRWQPDAKPPRWRTEPQPPESVRARLLSSFTALARQQPQAVEDARLQAHMDTGMTDEAPVDDGLPAGARFGTFFHDLMEQLPRFDLPADEIRAMIVPLSERHSLPLDEVQQAALCRRVQHTLQGQIGPFQLAQLEPGQYVCERGFVLNAPDLALKKLNSLMAALPGWSPLRSDAALSRVRLYLQGFIDLTVYHDGRYHVIDYKTNRLSCYDQDALIEEMAADYYLLQALIYMVALHRTLRFSLGDRYDPETHLGDAHYLFVRGMQAHTPHGVFSAGFTPELIEQADQLFGGNT